MNQRATLGIASLLLLALGALSPTAMAQGGWIQWGGTGHYYLPVHRPAGINFADANQEAQSQGGYLATSLSAGENDVLFSLIDSPEYWMQAQNPDRLLGPWLGGVQPPGATPPEFGWGWVTGEPWSFDNWSASEPNDYNGVEEDRLQFFSSDLLRRRKWNDLESGLLMYGYIVERESPPFGTPYCTATSNSTGGAATIAAAGTPSIAANNLVLRAAPVPNQTGLFYYGPNQLLLPFGNGFRCVGGIVGRLPVHAASNNLLRHEVDYNVPPNGLTIITPGSTWSFQAWFRDPAAGGSNFNLSNGIELLFLP